MRAIDWKMNKKRVYGFSMPRHLLSHPFPFSLVSSVYPWYFIVERLFRLAWIWNPSSFHNTHTHIHTECIRFTLYFSTNANNQANILLRYAAAVGVCEDEKNENRQIDFTVHILMRSVRASVCVRAGKSEKQKKDKFCFIADSDAESVRLWLGRKDFFCGTSAGAVLTSSCHSLQIADDACC